MMHANKGLSHLPLWEKILLLFVVFMSVSSLFAVTFRYIEREKRQNNETDKDFKLVSRDLWGASNPKVTYTWRTKPKHIIISHTCEARSCYNIGYCASTLRSMQRLHMIYHELNDIRWNFLVGGDGNVYEGRGWNYIGQHTDRLDWKSLGIALIGNFDFEVPTVPQIKATKNLIKYGVKIGKIVDDYILLGQLQCMNNTSSPGRYLYSEIIHWDHWELI